MNRFAEIVKSEKTILMEGAVNEYLRRLDGVRLDPHIVNNGLLYEEPGRAHMAELYREYLRIGREMGKPFLLGAPTWRSDRERIARSQYRNRPVIEDAVAFSQNLRAEFGSFGDMVFIGGLMACRGDCYKPEETLSADEAYHFHQWLSGRLADAGVDFLHAATLPAREEALGMSLAMAETGLPYIISFIIRPDGTLPDGVPLPQAVRTIDAQVSHPPLAYMVNCVHPSFLKSAIENRPDWPSDRMLGLQANASDRDPSELEGSRETHSDDPLLWARTMAGLYREGHIKILGGCCGTDQRHIRIMADLLRF